MVRLMSVLLASVWVLASVSCTNIADLKNFYNNYSPNKSTSSATIGRSVTMNINDDVKVNLDTDLKLKLKLDLKLKLKAPKREVVRRSPTDSSTLWSLVGMSPDGNRYASAFDSSGNASVTLPTNKVLSLYVEETYTGYTNAMLLSYPNGCVSFKNGPSASGTTDAISLGTPSVTTDGRCVAAVQPDSNISTSGNGQPDAAVYTNISSMDRYGSGVLDIFSVLDANQDGIPDAYEMGAGMLPKPAVNSSGNIGAFVSTNTNSPAVVLALTVDPNTEAYTNAPSWSNAQVNFALNTNFNALRTNYLSDWSNSVVAVAINSNFQTFVNTNLAANWSNAAAAVVATPAFTNLVPVSQVAAFTNLQNSVTNNSSWAAQSNITFAGVDPTLGTIGTTLQGYWYFDRAYGIIPGMSSSYTNVTFTIGSTNGANTILFNFSNNGTCIETILSGYEMINYTNASYTINTATKLLSLLVGSLALSNIDDNDMQSGYGPITFSYFMNGNDMELSNMIQNYGWIESNGINTNIFLYTTNCLTACYELAPTDSTILNGMTNGNGVTVTSTSSSAASSASSSSSNYISANIGTLAYVPAGSFQYDGSSVDVCTISSGYHMSIYDITRAQFVAVTGLADPSATAYSTGTNDPVQTVSWYHAMVFCNKLSMLEDYTPVYTINGFTDPTNWGTVPTSDNSTWDAVTANWSANGYRLPTEMEWMWASMGATSDSQPNDMAGGVNTNGYSKAFAGSTGVNVIGNYAWTYENDDSTTKPVGTKLPNELGLYDMSGNVFQWCWDWYAGYPTGAVTNYQGAASGEYRVNRGGSWDGVASYATSADRRGDNPYDRGSDFGFRVVRP
jgi:formylglycine-generating enzyme required for sulfatase activity